MRLIDANALNTLVALYAAENAYLNDTPLNILRMVSRWIAETPTIDAVPVVHGRWVDCENYNDIRQCSECGLIRNIYKQEGWKYCPNCGAKMDAVESTERICYVNGAPCNECIPGAPCARMDAKEES